MTQSAKCKVQVKSGIVFFPQNVPKSKKNKLSPKKWNKKLIDMNCNTLMDDHIEWADYVMVSSIIGQKHSTIRVVDRVHKI